MYTAPASRLNSLQWQVLSVMSLCWATSQNVITSQWAPGASREVRVPLGSPRGGGAGTCEPGPQTLLSVLTALDPASKRDQTQERFVGCRKSLGCLAWERGRHVYSGPRERPRESDTHCPRTYA